MQRFGPYVLIERIASGGMGEIFRAELRREGGFVRPVAVKRILPHLAQEQGFVAMFENEARLTARLHHPNIVQIYDYGRTDGVPWLAMEWVRGVDLRALLRPHELHLAHTLEVAIACCRALEHAWRAPDEQGEPLRIVHRDVSPHNVLVSIDGEIKLTDFGLARALPRESITGSGSLKGKLAYMAPEQASGERADARTDVFGVGALVYECLAGRTLHDPEAPLRDVLSGILDARFVALDALRPDLPPILLDAVRRALLANPDARHQDAGELGRALTDAAGVVGPAPTSLRALVAGRVGAVTVAGSRPGETVAGQAPPSGPLETVAGQAPPSGPLETVAGQVPPSGPLETVAGQAPPSGPLEMVAGRARPSGGVAGGLDATVVSPRDAAFEPPREGTVDRPAGAPALASDDRAMDPVEGPPRRRWWPLAALGAVAVGAAVAIALPAGPDPDPSPPAALSDSQPADDPPPVAGAPPAAGPSVGLPRTSPTPAPPGSPPRLAPTLAQSQAARRPAEVASFVALRRPADEAPSGVADPTPRVTVGSKTKRVPTGQADVRVLQFGAVRATLRLVPGAAGLALEADAKPYCEVRVDGRSRGTTPVSAVLARGRKHRVTLWRGGLELGGTAIRWE